MSSKLSRGSLDPYKRPIVPSQRPASASRESKKPESAFAEQAGPSAATQTSAPPSTTSQPRPWRPKQWPIPSRGASHRRELPGASAEIASADTEAGDDPLGEFYLGFGGYFVESLDRTVQDLENLMEARIQGIRLPHGEGYDDRSARLLADARYKQEKIRYAQQKIQPFLETPDTREGRAGEGSGAGTGRSGRS